MPRMKLPDGICSWLDGSSAKAGRVESGSSGDPKLPSELALSLSAILPTTLNVFCAELVKVPLKLLPIFQTLMPVSVPWSPASHPPLILYVPLKA